MQQKYLEDLEYFSLKLKSLYQTIDTISSGFQQQLILEDVVGCLEILGHSVNDIKSEMDKKIMEVMSMDNALD